MLASIVIQRCIRRAVMCDKCCGHVEDGCRSRPWMGSSRIERQGVEERLECRTGWTRRDRHIQRAINRRIEVIRTADKSQNLAVMRIHHYQRGIIDIMTHCDVLMLESSNTAFEDFLCQMLHIQIQCGAHNETLVSI